MANINRNVIGNIRSNKKDTPSYKEYKKYYSNPAWKSLRDLYLSSHPLCEVCASHGRVEPAVAVHHKIPFSRGVDEIHKEQLLLSENNLLSVCKTCHSLLHNKDNGTSPLSSLTDKEYTDGHQLKFMN